MLYEIDIMRHEPKSTRIWHSAKLWIILLAPCHGFQVSSGLSQIPSKARPYAVAAESSRGQTRRRIPPTFPLLYALDPTVEDTFASISRQIKSWRKQQKDQNEVMKLPKSTRFLLSYLKEDVIPLNCTTSQFQEISTSSVTAAIIEALRAAGEVNDYRYIMILINSVVSFASKRSVLLDTRIFGEALSALAMTSAGPSKLRSIWSVMWESNEQNLLIQPPAAFELNSMIKALGRQGRARSALNLFYQHCDTSKPLPVAIDSYTFSTLFQTLGESIQSVKQSSNNDKDSIHLEDQGLDPSKNTYETLMSPCWQWREAFRLLEYATRDNDYNVERLNNFVYSALLKVNEKASNIYIKGSPIIEDSPYLRYHNGGNGAMDVLRHMKSALISPDVVTCTSIMSSLDKSRRWKDALGLLDQMSSQKDESTWHLPTPNEYTYAAAISACARCNQVGHALDLLDQLRTQVSKEASTLNINTWVYNSAIASFLGIENRVSFSKRKASLFALLDRMEQDATHLGMNCRPDTVTYNTILAALSADSISISGHSILNLHKRSFPLARATDEVLHTLLSRMQQEDVLCDASTYRNAILLSKCNASRAVQLLLQARKEVHAGNIKRTELSFIIDAALLACAHSCCGLSALKVLQVMIDLEICPSKEPLVLILKAIGESGEYELANCLLQRLRGDLRAEEVLRVKYHFDLSSEIAINLLAKIQLEERHYVEIITAFVQANQLAIALQVLGNMKSDGISPSATTYNAMTFALCNSAISAATFHFGQSSDASDASAGAQTRTRTAMNLVGKISKPSFGLLSALVRACASSDMWHDAFNFLEKIESMQANDRKQIHALYRSLLSICARYGKVNEAKQVAAYMHGGIHHTTDVTSDESVQFMQVPFSSHISETETVALLSDSANSMMTAEDWKLLMISASKARSWAVCLDTLQLLAPRFEGIGRDPDSKDRESLSYAFTSALLCLEACGHYAWGIRAIDDWIQWTSLPPPKDSVFAVCRSISKNGQGRLVLDLLSRVREIALNVQDDGTHSYLSEIYSRALTAFHKNGDYLSADEVYCAAVEGGFLPWAVVADDGVGPLRMDLHGMSSATAHSAVRVALQREIQFSSNMKESETWSRDVIIVTGRGLNSSDKLRPVIRPEVQRMLMEEFYPPLNTASVSGNMGALSVSAHDVDAWISFHREQRGIRMLALADVIRSISSGSAIRRSLQMIANAKK